MGQIIDGKQLSLRLKGEMAEEVNALGAKYGRVPSLAVILVGENPASQSYVRGKIKAAEEVGIKSELITMPADTTEETLLAEIAFAWYLFCDKVIHFKGKDIKEPFMLFVTVTAQIRDRSHIDLLTFEVGFLDCSVYGN